MTRLLIMKGWCPLFSSGIASYVSSECVFSFPSGFRPPSRSLPMSYTIKQKPPKFIPDGEANTLISSNTIIHCYSNKMEMDRTFPLQQPSPAVELPVTNYTVYHAN